MYAASNSRNEPDFRKLHVSEFSAKEMASAGEVNPGIYVFK